MLKSELSFDDLQLSSQMVRDLINEKDSALKFVDLPFSLEGILQQIEKKQFPQEQREVLVDTLLEQYEGIEVNPAVAKNIDQLKTSNCYTVCTGHQLNLLSGPLYSIYKIAQTIVLAKQLNEKHTDSHFVPIFWLASEDHDYAEINHIHLFGKTIEWERDSQSKVVGRLSMEGCADFLVQVEELYQNPEMKAALESIIKPFKGAKNLAEATRRFIDQLFAEHGLVILDGDTASLKKQMVPLFQKEVNEGLVEKEVGATNELLTSEGYHNQVFVRDCNLFFIDENGKRTRVLKEDGQFSLSDQKLSAGQLIEKIEASPEMFSPNALMRPLYQETILPNLVYIGGGGEIAYWMQLKSLFEAAELSFPMLRTRDSYILLNKKEIGLVEERKLSYLRLKEDIGVIEKEIVLEESAAELSLESENELFSQLKIKLKEKISSIDQGMTASVEAELTKMEKSISNIESKMIKAAKKKQEVGFKKIEKLKEKIYPKGGFQERYENILPYLIQDDNIINSLLEISVGNESKIKILEK